MRIPPREVAGLLAVVVVGALIGVMGYVVVDAARAREQATRQLEAQAEQAIDTRIAQTARINRLSEQVASLQAEVTAQESTIAAQSQAIADLSAQLRRAGTEPITGDPADAESPGAGTPGQGTDKQSGSRTPTQTEPSVRGSAHTPPETDPKTPSPAADQPPADGGDGLLDPITDPICQLSGICIGGD